MLRTAPMLSTAPMPKKKKLRLTVIHDKVLALPPLVDILAIFLLVHDLVHIVIINAVEGVEGASCTTAPGRLERRQRLLLSSTVLRMLP